MTEVVAMNHKIGQLADRNQQYRILNAVLKERLYDEDTIVSDEADYCALQYHAHYLTVNVARKSPMARYVFSGPIQYEYRQQTTEIDSVEQLLDILNDQFNIPISARLREELLAGRDGFKLSYEQFETRSENIQESMKFSRMPVALNFFTWLTHMGETGQQDPLLYSESLVTEGHPTHPLSKTKLPLTEAEIRAYAPEFEQIIPLKVMLIHKQAAHVTSITGDEQFLINEVIPEYRHKLRAYLEPLGLKLKDYYAILVHPWQYEHTITTMYQTWIEERQLLPTPFTVDAHATLSFRTMDLIRKPFHVKLPVNVQATSAIRTVGPVTTVDGPNLSYTLQDILAQSNDVQVAQEPYGIYAEADEEEAKHLSNIVREKPVIRAHGMSIVTASLVNRNPVDKRTIVDSYLEWTGGGVTSKTIKHFIRAYATALIPPLIDYIQTCGIALEAHMQNTIVNLDQNFDMKFMVRDLGGARIDLSTLRQRRSGIEVTNQSLLASDIDAVIQKFQHAVIQNQFAELIHHFGQYDEVTEENLYDIVKQVIEDSIDDTKPHADALRRILFGPTITVKALMRMRMESKVKQYLTIVLDNPIREV